MPHTPKPEESANDDNLGSLGISDNGVFEQPQCEDKIDK